MRDHIAQLKLEKKSCKKGKFKRQQFHDWRWGLEFIDSPSQVAAAAVTAVAARPKGLTGAL